jgi:hypothetical protein
MRRLTGAGSAIVAGILMCAVLCAVAAPRGMFPLGVVAGGTSAADGPAAIPLDGFATFSDGAGLVDDAGQDDGVLSSANDGRLTPRMPANGRSARRRAGPDVRIDLPPKLHSTIG